MDFLSYISNIFENQSESQPLAFVIAFIATYSITPLVKSRCEEIKLIRKEAGRESPAVPRLGGIAILLSLIITVIFYLIFFGRFTPIGIKHLELEAIATGSIIIFFVGLLDDIKPLSAWIKLAAQIFSALAVWVMGIRVEFFANPVHYIDHARFSAFHLSEWQSMILTVAFLVVITNAINLIDGIDGLAVGVCMIAAVASWAINLSPILNRPDSAVLAATLAGACFAFLRYNFNPARIFLGDNGSYLLGFLLGCISLVGLTKKVTVVIISPIFVLLFFIPLVDIFFAVVRRAANKQPIFKPDFGHLHHILLKKGFSPKQINYFLYLITFTGGLLGTFLLGSEIGFTYLFISFSIITLWLFFSLVINAKRQRRVRDGV